MEPDLHGRIVLITGATSGIGEEAARQLSDRGATVVVGARDATRGEQVKKEIASGEGAEVQLITADLSVPDQVRGLAREFERRFDRLDVLINNAGVDVGGRVTTDGGLELTFAVNYLAPFVLTTSLLDLLQASTPARVVNVVSGGHRGGQIDFDDLQHERRFTGQRAYNDSKLALVSMTYELARRLPANEVTANCFDPGFVRGTNIGKTLPLGYQVMGLLFTPFMSTVAKAAHGLVQAATDPALASVTGAYLKGGKQVASSKESQDPELAHRLWESAEALTR
jgi:NAD(P)-dependent dehydrogenase (short-subunit alcohol dehydrogenase family)